MLTRGQMVERLVKVERDEIRAQWADLRVDDSQGFEPRA